MATSKAKGKTTAAPKKRKIRRTGGNETEICLDAEADSVMLAQVDAFQTKLNRRDTILGSEAEKLQIGIPMPAFSCRYLFGRDAYLLCRIVLLTGFEHSCKSSLLCEIGRWHLAYRGLFHLDENENKDYPELRNSIILNRKHIDHRLSVTFTRSLEGWQRFLTEGVKSARKLTTAEGGPGLRVPVCFGIDGMTSFSTESTQQGIMDDGAAGRGFPVDALSIARYMRAIPGETWQLPVSIVATNHSKPKQTEHGAAGSQMVGGLATKFMESLEIECTKMEHIKRSNDGGIKLRLRTKKSSVSPSDRSILVNFLWWVETLEDGTWQQVSMFDWYAASIDLLFSFRRNKQESGKWEQINSVVDLHEAHARHAWSKALGVSSKAPLSYHELGKLLETRQDLCEALYPILLIHKVRKYKPGVEFAEAIETACMDIDDDIRKRFDTGYAANQEITNALETQAAHTAKPDGDADAAKPAVKPPRKRVTVGG